MIELVGVVVNDHHAGPAAVAAMTAGVAALAALWGASAHAAARWLTTYLPWGSHGVHAARR